MSQHGYPERLSSRSKTFQEDALSQATIEVLVETLTGTAFEMTVSPLDTVFAIKSKIFRVEGIPTSQQHLLYNLKELDDNSSLKDHAIKDGATLRLVLSMRGGPISTRRLPLPVVDDVHWREIKELVESNRDDALEWLPSGCKVTVLLFRDGENINMIRVIENEDGTYSPLAENSSQLKSLLDDSNDDEIPGAVQENAVTMEKMTDLRKRMENLSVQRNKRSIPGCHKKVEENADSKLIQKTRSEETLSTIHGLFEEAPSADTYKLSRTYAHHTDADDSFSPLYDGNYTRYDYDCSFTDRYTLLPPIGGCSDSDLSGERDGVAECAADRIKLSDALAGSILVKSSGVRREAMEEEAVVGAAAILEEGVVVEGAVEECRSSQLAAKKLELSHAPLPATEYGPLVGGEAGGGGGWRVRRAFGSSSQLAPPAPRPHPPLSDALFSSSTSDLEKLKRNRLLPALSRHRNREHLHLSDERLDRAQCSLEVGSERRHRRIKKIAELEGARDAAAAATSTTSTTSTATERPALFRFRDSGYEAAIRKLPNEAVVAGAGGAAAAGEPAPPSAAAAAAAVPAGKKMARVRCGLCRKRLSIATVHRCRCGAEFCAPHRYAEVHGCAYDYKAHAHQYLQRANPLVSAPKLPKI